MQRRDTNGNPEVAHVVLLGSRDRASKIILTPFCVTKRDSKTSFSRLPDLTQKARRACIYQGLRRFTKNNGITEGFHRKMKLGS